MNAAGSRRRPKTYAKSFAFPSDIFRLRHYYRQRRSALTVALRVNSAISYSKPQSKAVRSADPFAIRKFKDSHFQIIIYHDRRCRTALFFVNVKTIGGITLGRSKIVPVVARAQSLAVISRHRVGPFDDLTSRARKSIGCPKFLEIKWEKSTNKVRITIRRSTVRLLRPARCDFGRLVIPFAIGPFCRCRARVICHHFAGTSRRRPTGTKESTNERDQGQTAKAPPGFRARRFFPFAGRPAKNVNSVMVP